MSRTYCVGIVGGGQLARMMYQESIGLGIQVKLLAEGPDVSAARVVRDVTVGDYTDLETVRAFARGCDVITFDHEHVPTQLLETLVAEGVTIRPGPESLLYAQDKAAMRRILTERLGAPCPTWRVCETPGELAAFGDEIGWPVIAKQSRGGYDGHGVWKIDSPAGVTEPYQDLTANSGEPVVIIGEQFIEFERELSAIVGRAPSGQAVAYPISETVQDRGMCLQSITPAPGLSDEQATYCAKLALDIADALDVVGMLAVELMQCRDGSVVVNELAMRPHNTGHWTLGGAHTSQFENHLRAVLDLPLGDPAARTPWVVMHNVLGGGEQDLTGALLHCFARDPRLRVELYGKPVTPRRKVGHVTAYGTDLDEVRSRASHAARYLMGEPHD